MRFISRLRGLWIWAPAIVVVVVAGAVVSWSAAYLWSPRAASSERGIRTGPLLNLSTLVGAFEVDPEAVAGSVRSPASGTAHRVLHWRADWAEVAGVPVQLDVAWNDARKPWPLISECRLANKIFRRGTVRVDLSARGWGTCTYAGEPQQIRYAIRRYPIMCGREVLASARYSQADSDDYMPGGEAWLRGQAADDDSGAVARAFRAVGADKLAQALATHGTVLSTPDCGATLERAIAGSLLGSALLTLCVAVAAVVLCRRARVLAPLARAEGESAQPQEVPEIMVCEPDEAVRVALMAALACRSRRAWAYEDLASLLRAAPPSSASSAPVLLLFRAETLPELRRGCAAIVAGPSHLRPWVVIPAALQDEAAQLAACCPTFVRQDFRMIQLEQALTSMGGRATGRERH